MDSSIQIEERAAQWLAKRDSGEWGDSDEAAFNIWLEQSTLHVVAFVRLEAAWTEAKRLKALSAGVRLGTVPSPEEWQLTPFFHKVASSDVTTSAPVSEGSGLSNHEQERQSITPKPPTLEPLLRGPQTPTLAPSSVKRWGLAASLLVVIGASIGYYNWPFDSTYRTPVGGIASVPMSDGSKVTLNTDSRIRLAVTETERRVELERGEAFFEVAKDPDRPFVVAAGGKRVIAVGTQFSVRRDRDDVRVFVAEGAVRVENETEPEAREGSNEFKLLTLSAGSIACASDAGVLLQESTVPEIESYLSWRTGHLIFRDTALADAVAEFNRYNTRKIVIEDPAVAAIRLSGKFRSTQFEAFVRLMEEGFPVRARRVGDEIVLTDSREATETAAAQE